MKRDLMQDFLSKLPEDTPVIVNFPHKKKQPIYLERLITKIHCSL